MVRPSLISISLAALASLSMAGYAQQQPLPQSSASREAWCADNPEKCRQAKERHEQWCNNNPQRCEKMKARRDAMREKCAQDPQACEQRKAEWRDKAKRRFEERCAKNPEKCKEWKNRADGNPPDKAKRRGADRGPSNSVPNQRN